MRAPEKLYVERRAAGFPLTGELLRRWADVEPVFVENYQSLVPEGKPDRQKRSLVLAVQPGELVKPFPCHEQLPSDPEWYVYHGAGCAYDCRYCFLQSYFEHAVPVLFVNVEGIVRAAGQLLESLGGAPARVHAGETADGLAHEAWTGLVRKLAPVFAEHPDATLEVRTKATDVGPLAAVTNKANVVPAWTLTPPQVARSFERGAPGVRARLAAAREAQRMGFRVGLRLDPMVRVEGWQYAYDELVAMIFDALEPDRIADAVLGTFRFNRGLEKVLAERHPDCALCLDEFVPGYDGKLRYFRPMRVAMYRHVLSAIRRRAPGLACRLCMETPAVHEACDDLLDPVAVTETHP